MCTEWGKGGLKARGGEGGTWLFREKVYGSIILLVYNTKNVLLSSGSRI